MGLLNDNNNSSETAAHLVLQTYLSAFNIAGRREINDFNLFINKNILCENMP